VGFFSSFLLINITLLSFHFSESGFKIQWVDDTHALGIFSSLSAGSVAGSVAVTEGCVAGSVAVTEGCVAGSVAVTEGFVAGSVAVTEGCVAGSVAVMEGFSALAAWPCADAGVCNVRLPSRALGPSSCQGQLWFITSSLLHASDLKGF